MFDLPENYNNVNDPLRSESEGVKLPFETVELWWYNGKPAMPAEIMDARRFGGWGATAEKVQQAYHPSQLPADWKLFEDLTNGEGKTYSAYLVRALRVAPIARRYRWLKTDTFNGSQVQILCYLGAVDANKQTIPWGPVVLTGKKYSGKAIDDAFKKFGEDTRDLRGGTAARWFYVPLGTFGSTPIFEKRAAKSGAASQITPCQLGKPANGYDTPTLESLFVGREIAAVILDLQEKAHDWVADWQKPKNAEQVEPDFAPAADEGSF